MIPLQVLVWGTVETEPFAAHGSAAPPRAAARRFPPATRQDCWLRVGPNDHGPTSDVDQNPLRGKATVQCADRGTPNRYTSNLQERTQKNRPEQGRIERLKAIPITRPERTTSCDVAQIVPLVFQMWCGSILKSCGGPKPEARTVRPENTTGSARRALIGAPHHPTCPKAGFFLGNHHIWCL